MAEPEKIFQETEEEDRRSTSAENRYRRTIFDVPVTVTVSLGRKKMTVSEILDLDSDSIVPLSAGVEDPVDLVVDNRVIARGELIELEDGDLAVKITEVVDEGEPQD